MYPVYILNNYLVIDLPPGTGDEPLSIFQLIPDCDGIVIVTTPQDVALLDSRKAVTFARTLNMPVIGVIESGDDGKPFVSYNSESAKVFREIVTKIEHFVSVSKGRSDMREKEVVI
jgi:Mrp family chromosome partitioning ATPase